MSVNAPTHLNEVSDGVPPAWFRAALEYEAERGFALVDGTKIAYRAWGRVGDPGVVLVHGGAAHSGWWDHVGPLLVEDRRRVVALDLSGHGDSARRDTYSLDQWADEVLAVASAAGTAPRPVVFGHSMGGFVTLRAAALHGARLSGIVVIDTPVREATPEEKAARAGSAFRPLRTYPSLEVGRSRFRPLPDQPVLDYVAVHIAEQSLRPTEQGWVWKFDPRVFARVDLGPGALAPVACPVTLIKGERGILSDEMAEVVYERLGDTASLIEIPDAGHHIMLDQPLALVAALRTLLVERERRAARAVSVEPE